MHRTRVRWGRLGTLMIVAVAAVSLAGGVARAHDAEPASRPAAARTYVVRSGDTVWGIARRIAGPSADPRPFVDRILQANRLDASNLRVGQRLVLPSA